VLLARASPADIPNSWASWPRIDRRGRPAGDDAVVARARGRAGHHPSSAEDVVASLMTVSWWDRPHRRARSA
jgi:hypothetical protein